MSGRRPSYVVIIGHGRSGTNWLLDLLDLSRETHCRNEADGDTGGTLTGMPGAEFAGQSDAELERRWDQAVRTASMRLGERDHWEARPKDYLYEVPRMLGLATAVKDPRTRRILATVVPALRGGEFRLPWWTGSEARLAGALPVFKLAGVPGWGAWILRSRPQARVLHIVRHPGGFLNSWRRRYLAKRDEREVAQANRDRLGRLVALHPSWAGVIGPIAEMGADESELWYWRYATRTILDAAAASSGCRTIVYERLASHTADVMKDVYDCCGIAWTAEVERGIAATGEASESIAGAWREELSPAHAALVEKVAAGSGLLHLWGEAD